MKPSPLFKHTPNPAYSSPKSKIKSEVIKQLLIATPPDTKKNLQRSESFNLKQLNNQEHENKLVTNCLTRMAKLMVIEKWITPSKPLDVEAFLTSLFSNLNSELKSNIIEESHSQSAGANFAKALHNNLHLSKNHKLLELTQAIHALLLTLSANKGIDITGLALSLKKNILAEFAAQISLKKSFDEFEIINLSEDEISLIPAKDIHQLQPEFEEIFQWSELSLKFKPRVHLYTPASLEIEKLISTILSENFNTLENQLFYDNEQIKALQNLAQEQLIKNRIYFPQQVQILRNICEGKIIDSYAKCLNEYTIWLATLKGFRIEIPALVLYSQFKQLFIELTISNLTNPKKITIVDLAKKKIYFE